MKFLFLFFLFFVSCSIPKRIERIENWVLHDEVEFYELSDSVVIAKFSNVINEKYNIYQKQKDKLVRHGDFAIFPICNCSIKGKKKRRVFFSHSISTKLKLVTKVQEFESSNGFFELDKDERIESLRIFSISNPDGIDISNETQYIIDNQIKGNFIVIDGWIMTKSGVGPEVIPLGFFKNPIYQALKARFSDCEKYYHDSVYGRKL